MGDRLKGRSAVVTGAGRGLGRALAVALAEEGANVVINDLGVSVDGTGIDRGPADEVVAEIRARGGNAVANYDSVATIEGGEQIIEACVNAFGRIDILVNAAGILRDRMIWNMTEEEWDAVIAVHLKGHFNTIKPASILMRQQGFGRIVNFSSGSGLRGIPGQANYGAAKAAIVGLTRVVARDVGSYGITCNAIAPTAWTRMTATASEEVKMHVARAGGGVEASPEAVAPMVVYLCTDEAWNINGQLFSVVGGVVALTSPEVPIREIVRDGMWSIDDLKVLIPEQLMAGIINPAPPPEDMEIPGRTPREA